MPKEVAITEASIKSVTRQFDLSLVFKLPMPKLGLRRIENLDLVPSLTELDLSHNRIARLEGLEGLESLKRLIVAHNEIDRIEGLAGLDALETFHVQGNRVSNLDDVQGLAALPCLRHLQVQVRGGAADERNPMCDHPAYRNAVRRMLPALQTLDGERTILADATLPKDAAAALGELTFAEPEPWLKDFDWDGDDKAGGRVDDLGPLKGDAAFAQTLTECKRLSAKAAALVEDYAKLTPRG